MKKILSFYKCQHLDVVVSCIPLAVMLGAVVAIIVFGGVSLVQDYGYLILGSSALVCLGLGAVFSRNLKRGLAPGFVRSFRQVLPAVPILLLIGALSSTWMLSGVVPTLIDYGLTLLGAQTFLFVACFVCAVVSVVTGSSWTTIATVGVALMGVGSVMGYHPGWVAGAIISGAYFGDKVSPLSDTTVLAASTCGVPLLRHIAFLLRTSLPAIALALGVYLGVGYFGNDASVSHSREISEALSVSFNVTPWTLLIPVITLIMVAFRCGTIIILSVGVVTGLVGIWAFQPQVLEQLASDGSVSSQLSAAFNVIFTSTQLRTGSDLLDPLVSTSGVKGMLSTVYLVLAAGTFGGAMIGTGMLSTITSAISSRLHHRRSLISTTVGSGIFLNSVTGDQYMSIIIGANLFKSTYCKCGYPSHVLSRTLEDSVSVTSVLIPWNSCGLTQSTVLGVSTFVYFPFCLFNLMSPVISLISAWTGWGIRGQYRFRAVPGTQSVMSKVGADL